MLQHRTGTSTSTDRVVFLDHSVSAAPEARAWRRSSKAWRSAAIAVSIVLLSITGMVIASLFYLNDPYWVRWGVGLVLAFNILVAARAALSPRPDHAKRG